MQERIILFDLDGTLTDSGPGIMKASQFALRAYGVERDWQELDFFVGPPLDETFGQFMPKEDIPGAIDQFRVYYHDVGWLENEPYPGVREMLDTLQKNGFRLFVATSKLESMAVQVLGHFGLAPYFEAICGAPGDNTQAGKKVNVIRAALQKAGCTDLTQAMIVGDRKHDIIGGKLAGIRTAGILYGYGSREELAHDILHQCGDDGRERAADDHADCHVQHVAAHGECLEFFQEFLDALDLCHKSLCLR